jgi:hypothetical protein
MRSPITIRKAPKADLPDILRLLALQATLPSALKRNVRMHFTNPSILRGTATALK